MSLPLLSHFSRVRLCVIPQTAAHQAPPSLGFSRQEHWSGLPFPSPMHESEKSKSSRSVVSDSSRPHGLQPTRLLCPWDFPGKGTGLGCHCLLRDTILLDTIYLFLLDLKKKNKKHESVSHSVVPYSFRSHGLQPTRLLCPWDFPGKGTGVGCHCLLLFPLYISPKYGTSLPASTTEARISLPYLTAKVEQKKLPRVLIKIMKTHAILILFLLHHYH